ncbi:MAG: hypothetical protein KF764_09755 [Labilithrix sp.]|nr:hypothetical protein [Labilithrix sp.]MBX3221947.1 hypothetical protein [Labilithrix sp.]
MTARRALSLTLAAMGTLALGIAPRALAQTSPKAPAKPPASASAAAPAPPPRPVHASAIVRVAIEIAEGLGEVPPGALVAVSPLVSDVPAPKGDELAIRLATHIAGRLGVAQAHPQPATLAAARAVSGRAASLVYVQLEIAKGELRATADLYPVVSNGWERLRNPAPGPRAHAFTGAPLDAEVRTFLQPIVLEQASVHKAKHDEADVLAIGCGDVDSDGGNEIVLATRTRVVIGKLRGGKLAVVRATPWSELASRAPVPMREPTASVVIPRGHRGELLVGMTDRGAVAVDASLVTRRQLTGLPIPGGDGEACAVPSPEIAAFEGSGVACAPPAKGEPAAVLPVPAARFDAIASLDLVGKDGAVAQIVAAREPTGKIRLRRSDASGKSIEAPIDGAGAELALADLDLDGTPEIAFSGDFAETDVLAVWSWRPGSGLVQRLRYPTKEPVRAIAACPPEERGLPALVAVVGGEVWLVR